MATVLVNNLNNKRYCRVVANIWSPWNQLQEIAGWDETFVSLPAVLRKLAQGEYFYGLPPTAWSVGGWVFPRTALL